MHRYGSRRTLGHYEIYDDDALGRGGNGVVFLGHHPRLGRPVAFKRIELDVPHDAVERFVSEAHLAGSLTHPSIVFVFDVFEDEGVPYIAMEYVERGALRKWLPVRREQAFIAIEGMLSALAYLIVFGSWLAYTAYAWLLQNAPISKVSTYAYVNPVVAIALGWLILDEGITATTLIGAGIIVASVALVVRAEAPRAGAARETAAAPRSS